MANDPVLARWVATFEAELPDKTQLEPRVTVVEIGRHEAVQSDYWQPVEASEPSSVAELRELADQNDVKVAGNAKAETIRDRLEEAGVELVTYEDVEIEI